MKRLGFFRPVVVGRPRPAPPTIQGPAPPKVVLDCARGKRRRDSPGCGQRAWATPSQRAAPASAARKSKTPRGGYSGDRTCSLARVGPSAPAGSARARRFPVLPAGVGRSRRSSAGWLCQSPRAWAAAHVSKRHVRARPRGLRQLPLQERVGRGSAHR